MIFQNINYHVNTMGLNSMNIYFLLKLRGLAVQQQQQLKDIKFLFTFKYVCHIGNNLLVFILEMS
jgi:hypothetical protein